MAVVWNRLTDILFALFLALSFAVGAGGLYYHNHRIEAEALESHRQFAILDARYNTDLVTQTVNTVELTLRTLLEAGYDSYSRQEWGSRLGDALRHAPHLRSLSLVDDGGRVVVSSNPDNVGLAVDFSVFLPRLEAWESVLQVGPAYGGRDLADGVRLPAEQAEAPAISFLPLALSLAKGEGGRLTLVAVLNGDFLLNRFNGREAAVPRWVDVVRYDGALLFSTRGEARTQAMVEANRALAVRWQAGREVGTVDEDLGEGARMIAAYRSDRVLPVAVITRIDRSQAVADARDEGRRQLLVLMPLLILSLAVTLWAYLLFRRAMVRRLGDQARELERFTHLLDALPASVLLFGADGRVAVSNRTWRESTRENALPLPEGPGLHYTTLAAALEGRAGEAGPSALAAGIAAVLQGEADQYSEDCGVYGPRGRRWLQLLVRPYVRDQQRGAVLLQLDISERRLAEEELRLNSRVFEVSAEAIVVTDAHNRIVSVNPAFTRITGYAPEEVVGRNPKFLGSGEQGPEFYRDMWAELLAHGLWRGEIINRRKNGESYSELLTISSDLDGDGRPRHFIGVFSDISERKAAEAALRESEERYRLTVAAVRDGLWDWDLISGHVRWDARCFEMLGYGPEAFPVTRQIWEDMIHPADVVRVRSLVANHMAAGTPFQCELRLRTAAGAWRWVEARGQAADMDDRGRPRRAVGTHTDISNRKEAEARLRLLDAALAAAANAVVITDTDAVIEWVNPAFARLTGYSREEAIGRKPKELVKSGLQSPELYQDLWNTILGGRVWRGEVINKRKDGELYDEALTITPVKDEHGALTHFVAIKEDISERKRQEAELRRLATTDTLTGVCNRRSFLEQVERELQRHRRYCRPAALLMLDIDHFKAVNDSHGHAAGDAVLAAFAGAVKHNLRATDIMGRLGGEEFAVLLADTDPAGAQELAERLCRTVAEMPVAVAGGTLRITVSIGLAAFTDQEAGVESLLGRADGALYRAKARGRNRVEELIAG